MTSLRGGAAPEASSAVGGSGGIAVSRVRRGVLSRAQAAACTNPASAAGGTLTPTRMAGETPLHVGGRTMITRTPDRHEDAAVDAAHRACEHNDTRTSGRQRPFV